MIDFKLISLIIIPLFCIICAPFYVEIVEAGHSAAATYFGEVSEEVYSPGLHFVTPFLNFTHYDCREKTVFFEGLGVPSQDKLVTTMNVSVQYRLSSTMTPIMLEETGTEDQVVKVHLIPKLHSLMREVGKGITRAEDFFSEQTQTNMQLTLQASLAEFTAPKGIEVTAVLLSDITLPRVIRDAVDQTKQRQEQTAREQAEFERFQIEQQKKVAEASAMRQAAEEEATMKRTLADAEAYEIITMGNALRENPEILRLEYVKAWDGVLPRVLGGSDSMDLLLPISDK